MEAGDVESKSLLCAAGESQSSPQRPFSQQDVLAGPLPLQHRQGDLRGGVAAPRSTHWNGRFAVRWATAGW